MREKVASKYRVNALAGKKKHIYSRLLDYFTTFVVSFLMFTVVYAIAARVPAFTKYASAYTNHGNDITEFVVTSHLQNRQEDASALADIGVDANQYVTRIMKNTAYVLNEKIPVPGSEDIYVPPEQSFVYERTSYALDNMSYYYMNFKKTREVLVEGSNLNNYVFDGVDYKDDIETYQYLKIMQVNADIYVASDDSYLVNRGGGVSRFTVLNLETFNKLKSRVFLNDTSSQEANNLYGSIYQNYIKGAEFGIKDIESNSVIYKGLLSAFNGAYQDLSRAIMVVYFISYALGFVILTVVVRLVSKEWITIGMKVMGVGMTDHDNNEPAIWQNVIYHLANFVLFASTSIISLFFIGIFGVTSLQLFPGFTLLALLIVLLIFNVLSLGLSFFAKKPLDFSTFLSFIYLKDKNDYDVPVGMENISDLEFEEKEKENGNR